MKILFGKKYYGKSVSECPSGFLIWIIEEFNQADWTLILACKKELSDRLKLDWQPPTDQSKQIEQLKEQLKQAQLKADHFHDVIGLAPYCKGNIHLLVSYMNNPEYMKQIYFHIKDCNAST